MEDNKETKTLNVYQRINNVRREVGYIQKDKVVQGYKVVTHDVVTAHVRESLIKHGIIVVPSLITKTVVQDTGMATKGGVPIIRFEGNYEVIFINEDDPKDRVAVVVAAHAVDSGDKAPGKALSYATKYAVLKLFTLETGEEDEGRMEGKAESVSNEDYNQFHVMAFDYFEGDEEQVEKTGATLRRLAATYNLKQLDELPKAKMAEALDRLKEALKKPRKQEVGDERKDSN